MLVVIFRGFRVSPKTLDDFLEANGVIPTFGNPPFEPNEGETYQVSYSRDQMALLKTKLIAAGANPDAEAKIFIPTSEENEKEDAYVAYCWVFVDVKRKIDLSSLPETVPAAFMALYREILGHSQEKEGNDGEFGLFCVTSHERTWVARETS